MSKTRGKTARWKSDRFRSSNCHQNGKTTRRLTSGAWIPPHAIPDHILLDGRPVFFPGTYSPNDDQGGEPWGITPPFNNHYDVIWLAHMLVNRTGQTALAMIRVGADGVDLRSFVVRIKPEQTISSQLTFG